MLAVLPPHDAYDAAKVEALVRAFQRGHAVEPVVLVQPTKSSEPLVALTGSHRIEAMTRAFGSIPEHLVLLIDEQTLRRALDQDEKKALSAYLRYQLGPDTRRRGPDALWHHAYYEPILRAVASLGPEYAEAVSDQF